VFQIVIDIILSIFPISYSLMFRFFRHHQYTYSIFSFIFHFIYLYINMIHMNCIHILYNNRSVCCFGRQACICPIIIVEFTIIHLYLFEHFFFWTGAVSEFTCALDLFGWEPFGNKWTIDGSRLGSDDYNLPGNRLINTQIIPNRNFLMGNILIVPRPTQFSPLMSIAL